MPNYHFNLANHERIEDDEGTELPDLQAARIQAVVFAADYLHDTPELVWDGRRFSVEVTDDEGQMLFAIRIEAEETSR